MEGNRQERRLVTLLFSDLTNSTGIAASLEPEEFADLLERIRAFAFRAVPSHGGEIVRIVPHF
jgi:class 3 adenylate cyclase